ncbi:hypothetical protein L9F63_017592, partial [Diploptera punctata]
VVSSFYDNGDNYRKMTKIVRLQLGRIYELSFDNALDLWCQLGLTGYLIDQDCRGHGQRTRCPILSKSSRKYDGSISGVCSLRDQDHVHKEEKQALLANGYPEYAVK